MDKNTELRLIKMSDVEPTKVEWLWYPYIPYGKVTIIQGDPGEGKTTLILNLAALLSKGEKLPESNEKSEPINIIYQTAEDGLSDTVKPRLIAANANQSMFTVIDESKHRLSLTDDRLEGAIKRTNARLVILDPIQAYIGASIDMNRLNEIRDLMTHLKLIAEKFSRLIHSQGENCVIKFAFSGIPKLYACPIFFSAKLYDDYALVTIKEKDKKLLIEALNLKDEAIIDRSTKRYLPDVKYDEMKKRAEFLGVKVEFLIIDEKDIDKLTKEKDRYVAFAPENGKIKLAFLPQNKDYVLHCLYPDKYQAQGDDLFSVTRNSKVNTRLKSEAALGGKQMRYRTLTRTEVEELHKQTGGQEMFAVFSKSENGQEEKYNVAFKEDDEKRIEGIIGTQSKPRFRR